MSENAENENNHVTDTLTKRKAPSRKHRGIELFI